MLKKVAAAAATVVVVGALAAGGLVLASKASGEAKLRELFSMAKAGTPAQREAQLSAKLKASVDPELGAAYLKEVATRFGDFQAVELSGMAFADKVDATGRTRTYEGRFVFAQRVVPLKVEFVEDGLITLNVDDPVGGEIIRKVDRAPARTEAYERRGAAFLEAFASGRGEEAYALTGEAFQKDVPRADFVAEAGGMKALRGVKRIDVVGARPRAGAPKLLDVVYRIEGGIRVLEGKVTFEFAGLRGHLLGYQTRSI